MTRLAPFAAAMRVADPTLGGHVARVTGQAATIARRLQWDERRLDELRLGAALHDVGKVNVRHDVLTKPGALDPEELAHIRTHPVEGTWLVAGVRSLRAALPYILFHHERWDGAGYPTGRAGSEIPIEGRLLAIVDAFDAMTSPRPYRDALPLEAALAEVERCAGTQFDPTIARVFLDAVGAGEIEDDRLPAAASF